MYVGKYIEYASITDLKLLHRYHKELRLLPNFCTVYIYQYVTSMVSIIDIQISCPTVRM